MPIVYTARLFVLAAIMYVDDTDLIHWVSSPDTSDKDFIEEGQAASNDYGTISQATGAILKPEKSSV